MTSTFENNDIKLHFAGRVVAHPIAAGNSLKGMKLLVGKSDDLGYRRGTSPISERKGPVRMPKTATLRPHCAATHIQNFRKEFMIVKCSSSLFNSSNCSIIS